MLKLNTFQQNPLQISRQIFPQKSIEVLLTKELTNFQKIPLSHKNLLQTNQTQVITVPIKEYSNKFLRDKKKQELSNHNKKKQPFLTNHLQNNRKLISDFKKIKGRSQKFKKSMNKENGDFIIHNLLLQKNQSSIVTTSNLIHKTIFGNFAENCQTQSVQQISEESCLFDKGWKTVKNENPFQMKKEVYQKICQKQKSILPQYRKKSKTFVDVLNLQNHEEKEKKMERISTSRALQKYSKIIKINPQHGKIQKMKIKKQLAKSLRFQSSQKGDFQTKQIILSRKQNPYKQKNNIVLQQVNRNYSIDHTNHQNENERYHLKTPEKSKFISSKENLSLGKIAMFTAGAKLKRMRKFSHQVQSYKKCVTEQKSFNQNEQILEDFQINGWDINF